MTDKDGRSDISRYSISSSKSTPLAGPSIDAMIMPGSVGFSHLDGNIGNQKFMHRQFCSLAGRERTSKRTGDKQPSGQ